jgi:hypothetical protein
VAALLPLCIRGRHMPCLSKMEDVAGERRIPSDAIANKGFTTHGTPLSDSRR